MEFEYHITVNDLTLADKEAFVELCKSEQVKPLMIVLDKGNHIHQPMFTGVIKSADFHEANKEIEKIVAKFKENGFTIMRKKVETPPKHEKYFHQPITKHFKPYFEWHGKVEVDDMAMVKNLCEGLGGHLSRNSLNPNGKVRFITVREYKSKEKFYERVQKIHSVLQANKIVVLKEQYELCIYDSREELDSGWIS
ncbi:hypothetical protein [Thermoflavimicrobium dichotomicum]|uniref:Uncharacterized protein n=1 Tax=Thermoflavimicrobium dichotomicum TaxID=46223 RepID=A0A1I3LLN0_9BACL|nr:hypothetical protein [Thermoflavimicrobium dichotomicum]SFI85622.1 hypothetical protein SAMN05421852_102242 [Thermoflavimicrobium dichotomicum]